EPDRPPPQKPGPSAAFQDGLADRGVWEHWVVALTGDYREGAEYWSGQRSLPSPGSCYSQGYSRLDFVNGCIAAKQRLTPSDQRRKSEPNYKEGWNSYSEPL